MPVSAEVREQVANIAREALYEKYPEGFLFDPIIVENKEEYIYGYEYLEISIVYDGEYERLDPAWSLYRRISPALLDIGIEEIPSHSFCEKSEWEAGPPK